MPWVALGFNTLYLQLLGFSDMRAAALQALFLLGVSLGSFGGGYIGEMPDLWKHMAASLEVLVGQVQQGEIAPGGIVVFE